MLILLRGYSLFFTQQQQQKKKFIHLFPPPWNHRLKYFAAYGDYLDNGNNEVAMIGGVVTWQPHTATVLLTVHIVDKIYPSLHRGISRASIHSTASSSRSSEFQGTNSINNHDIFERLLSTPVGRITNALWHEVATQLQKLPNPDRLFIVLHRLASEVIATTTTVHLPIEVRDSKRQLNFGAIEAELFNPALQNWKMSFLHNTISTSRTTNVSSDEILKNFWGLLKQYATQNVICMDGITYSIFIDTIGKCSSHHNGTFAEQAPLLAEVVVQDAIDLARHRNATCQHPNVDTINSLLNVWSKSGRPEAPEVANNHWYSLLNWSTYRDNCRPTAYTYSSMIHVMANSGRPNAVDHVQIFLDDMENRLGLGEPRVIAYNTALKVLVTLPGGQGSRLAHELLNRMIYLNQENNRFALDDTTGFGFAVATVLHGYRQSGNVDSMQALVGQMESLADLTGNRDYLPNAVSYATLIDVYASRGQPQQAEKILKHMLRVASKSDDDRAKPNLVAWNTILKAWAKSSHPDSVNRIKAILISMAQILQGPIPVDSFNVLLSYYMNRGDRDSAILASELLDEMKSKRTVDAVSYNTVLRAWGKAGYPDQAASLLEELYSPHVHHRQCVKEVMVIPATMHFNTVIDAWRARGDPALIHIQQLLARMEYLHRNGLPTGPDAVTYSMYLDCLSRSSSNEGPELAEQILRGLVNSQSTCVNSRLILDGVTFGTVLAAWARSSRPDSAERLLGWIRYMQSLHVKLTERMYNMVICSLSNKGQPDAAHKLLSVMRNRNFVGSSENGSQNSESMERDNSSGAATAGENSGGLRSYQPNLTAYRALLEAWAKVGHPDMAAQVLQLMILDLEAGQLDDSRRHDKAMTSFPPSSFSPRSRMAKITTKDFNMVLRAWFNSSHANAADNVAQGVATMKALTVSGRMNVAPDLSTYGIYISTLLQFCNTSKSDHHDRVGKSYDKQHQDDDDNNNDERFSKQITQILKEMDAIHDALWKEQGPGVCRKMKGELSRCNLLERDIHLHSLNNLLNRRQIIL